MVNAKIQYNIVGIDSEHVYIQFISMDDELRGKGALVSHRLAEYALVHSKSCDYSVFSAKHPDYQADSRCLMVPGTSRSRDSRKVRIPVADWNPLRVVLDQIAGCVGACPNSIPEKVNSKPDTEFKQEYQQTPYGQADDPAPKQSAAYYLGCCYAHAKQLFGEHAPVEVQYSRMDDKWRGKGVIAEVGGHQALSADCDPWYSAASYRLYLPGNRSANDTQKFLVPLCHWPAVRKLFDACAEVVHREEMASVGTDMGSAEQLSGLMGHYQHMQPTQTFRVIKNREVNYNFHVEPTPAERMRDYVAMAIADNDASCKCSETQTKESSVKVNVKQTIMRLEAARKHVSTALSADTQNGYVVASGVLEAKVVEGVTAPPVVPTIPRPADVKALDASYAAQLLRANMCADETCELSELEIKPDMLEALLNTDSVVAGIGRANVEIRIQNI